MSLIRLASFFLFFISGVVQAAPCCGSAGGGSRLLLGEEALQLSVSVDQAFLAGKSFETGRYLFYQNPAEDQTTTLALAGATRLGIDTQVGFGVPILRRTVNVDSQTALGDLTGFAGYEFLSVTRYSSPWPKGLFFLEARIPTGRSLFDSELDQKSDVTGRGFYALRTGVLLSRGYSILDYAVGLSVFQEFDRSFRGEMIRVEPGVGLNANAGIGVSPPFWNRLRLGVQLAIEHQAANRVQFQDALAVSGLPRRVWTATSSAAVLLAEGWTVAANYRDQTVFGSSSNSNLNRIFGVELIRRWMR